MNQYSCDFLYHHGIKGMRWGVRRYQNKNGDLTDAGRKRYKKSSDSTFGQNKSKHQLKLEQKYRDNGLNKSQAEKRALRDIRIERVFAVAAGMTVAAAGAYVVKKNLDYKCDKIIKSGKTLQRIEFNKEGEKLHGVFYAAKNRGDKIRYAGLLGKTREMQFGKSYIMKMAPKSDIKVASRKHAMEAFSKLYKNDADFRSSVESYVSKHFNGKNAANVNDLGAKNMRKLYENFNSALVGMRNDPKSDAAANKFYSVLKKSGYGAIQDINDMKFSGYKARNPLIIFGQNDNIMVKSFREMEKGEADRRLIQRGAEQVLKRIAIGGAAAGSVKAAENYIETGDPTKDE